jgi:hypothetical protein
MGDLKSIGSEKLTGQAKINRIMEIARYGETSKNTELHIKTNSFTKRAADGNIYAIVHEKDGYYVKSGLNESSLDYVNGLSNKRKNRYRSYSAALKRLNLMLKPINEEYNDGYGDSMYEQEEQGEKFVLKPDGTPEGGVPAPPAPPAAPAPAAPAPPAPAGGGLPMDDMGDMGDMGDMEAAYDDMGGDDMDDVDVDVDMEGGGEDFDQLEQTPTVKSIQKLTGKLGQKMREYEDDMDSDMIKYVLNSVIAAVDLDTLDDEDRDDIVSRLEPELEDDYGMEDDFEADVDIDMDDDEDFDMGGEEVDVDMDVDMGMEEPQMPLNEGLIGFWKWLKLCWKLWKSLGKVSNPDEGQKAFNKLMRDNPAPEGVRKPKNAKELETMYNKEKAKQSKGGKAKRGSGGSEGLEETLKNRVNTTLKKYFKLSDKEKGRKMFNEEKNRYFIKESIKSNKKQNNTVNNCETIEQELKVKTIIEHNRNIRYRGKTKGGSIVLEDSRNKRRFGVTRKGELIK